MEIEEDYIRKYTDSEYFASIIGYTGKISTTEYEELSEKNDSYSLTDIIGKSGIEQVRDEKLQGKKGSETVFVDVRGKELETRTIKNRLPAIMCICRLMQTCKKLSTIY